MNVEQNNIIELIALYSSLSIMKQTLSIHLSTKKPTLSWAQVVSAVKALRAGQR